MEVRMKQARQARKWSQVKVAEAIGISDSGYSKLENGINNPSDRTIKLFCDALNISESWLRTGEGEMEVRPPEDIVDRLAREYHLGVPHVALLRAAARVIQEFPEEVAMRLIDEIISELRQAASHPQAAADALLDRRMRDHMPDHQDESSSTS